MWVLTTYHPHNKRDGDYGTPPTLSNMFSPALWSTLECLLHLKKKKKSYRIILTKINPDTRELHSSDQEQAGKYAFKNLTSCSAFKLDINIYKLTHWKYFKKLIRLPT